MQHLIEIKADKSPIGKRMLACVSDEGKLRFDIAFNLLEGENEFVMCPCKMCYGSMLVFLGTEMRIASQASRTLIYRGYVLTSLYGFDFPSIGSEAYHNMIAEVDNYIKSDGNTPMHLKGVRVEKLEFIKEVERSNE